MTLAEAQTRALLSIIDVLEELCMGLAYGATPEKDWAEIVSTSFNEHRKKLREAER
jgi:hypothetical protein